MLLFVPNMISNRFTLVILLLTLLSCISPGYLLITCRSDSNFPWESVTYCSDNQYCCEGNTACCSNQDEVAEFISGVVALLILISCCICCYRCCCRRQTNAGMVYAPADTNVGISLPPQQHVGNQPYPVTVAPTPYPQYQPAFQTQQPVYQPQPATNPYFNMPPPPYNQVVHDPSQQAGGGTATAPSFQN